MASPHPLLVISVYSPSRQTERRCELAPMGLRQPRAECSRRRCAVAGHPPPAFHPHPNPTQCTTCTSKCYSETKADAEPWHPSVSQFALHAARRFSIAAQCQSHCQSHSQTPRGSHRNTVAERHMSSRHRCDTRCHSDPRIRACNRCLDDIRKVCDMSNSDNNSDIWAGWTLSSWLARAAHAAPHVCMTVYRGARSCTLDAWGCSTLAG